MSISRGQPISRRSAIAGIFASWALLPRVGATAQNTVKPPTVDLGQGLEIRDYRLFPTADAMRFIVEIHNTTDTAVDTPEVGVVLPSLSDGNYGWANPVSTVLHPHHSDCLVGIAPAAMISDVDWEGSEWAICDDISTKKAAKLADWEIDISHTIKFDSSLNGTVHVEVTNKSESDTTGWFFLQGIVWDPTYRICGAFHPLSFKGLAPEETATRDRNIPGGLDHNVNPLLLLDTLEGLIINLGLQIEVGTVNPPCAPVMPWNR